MLSHHLCNQFLRSSKLVFPCNSQTILTYQTAAQRKFNVAIEVSWSISSGIISDANQPSFDLHILAIYSSSNQWLALTWREWVTTLINDPAFKKTLAASKFCKIIPAQTQELQKLFDSKTLVQECWDVVVGNMLREEDRLRISPWHRFRLRVIWQWREYNIVGV